MNTLCKAAHQTLELAVCETATYYTDLMRTLDSARARANFQNSERSVDWQKFIGQAMFSSLIQPVTPEPAQSTATQVRSRGKSTRRRKRASLVLHQHINGSHVSVQGKTADLSKRQRRAASERARYARQASGATDTSDGNCLRACGLTLLVAAELQTRGDLSDHAQTAHAQQTTTPECKRALNMVGLEAAHCFTVLLGRQ